MSRLHNQRTAGVAPSPTERMRSAPSAPLSVVVIDDDVTVDESFGQMLQAAGYETHTESSCQAGLSYLETARPSVLILDLHLPDGTGLVCLRRLRTWPQHRYLPVAILTGDYFLDEEVARELAALGARVFFKPVWEEDLLAIVRELLAGEDGHSPTGAIP
jgi:DNA-binding response OmpR family regulator